MTERYRGRSQKLTFNSLLRGSKPIRATLRRPDPWQEETEAHRIAQMERAGARERELEEQQTLCGEDIDNPLQQAYGRLATHSTGSSTDGDREQEAHSNFPKLAPPRGAALSPMSSFATTPLEEQMQEEKMEEMAAERREPEAGGGGGGAQRGVERQEVPAFETDFSPPPFVIEDEEENKEGEFGAFAGGA